MVMTTAYPASEPARAELEQTSGLMLVEFGAPWCGICQAAQPAIAAALAEHPELPHLKVSDGKGKPLGRSFGVKLWPTLIALRDGTEVARLVRPTTPEAISAMLRSSERPR